MNKLKIYFVLILIACGGCATVKINYEVRNQFRLEERHTEELLKLAHQCGIKNVGEIRVYGPQPAGIPRISIKSKEIVRNRNITYKRATVRYDKWDRLDYENMIKVWSKEKDYTQEELDQGWLKWKTTNKELFREGPFWVKHVHEYNEYYVFVQGIKYRLSTIGKLSIPKAEEYLGLLMTQSFSIAPKEVRDQLKSNVSKEKILEELKLVDFMQPVLVSETSAWFRILNNNNDQWFCTIKYRVTNNNIEIIDISRHGP